MRRFLSIASVVCVFLLAPVARAGDTARHPLTVSVSSGSLVPEDHVYMLGPGHGSSAPPTLFVGMTADVGLRPRLHLAADAGAEIALGWVVGASARFVAIDRAGFTAFVGAGPLLALASPFGAGTFARADIGARYLVPSTRLAASLTAGLAYSLFDGGIDRCGTDTCNAYITRGDRLIELVGSIGYAFDL